MGLNQNHTVEELDNIRCAIVEKNVAPQRANFLAALLSGNGYTVICVPFVAPKAKVAAPKEGEEPAIVAVVEEPKEIESYTVGVTDVNFNSINAVYGRLLKSKEGNVVTMAYWLEKEAISNDDVPYFERGVSLE